MIGNLLLNAVALECVITVDELVYDALAPRRVRKVRRVSYRVSRLVSRACQKRTPSVQ